MESDGDGESSAAASASASKSLSNAAALSRLGLSSANPWLQPANAATDADDDADAEPESAAAQPAAAPVDAQLQGMLDAGVPLRSASKLVRQMFNSSGSTARGRASASGTAAASQSVDEAVGNDEVTNLLFWHGPYC